MADLKSIETLGLKYYISGTKVNSYVSYKLLDGDNKLAVTGDNPSLYDNAACFSTVTYSLIPKTAKKIVFYRDISTIPYSYEIIERWVSELNKLGFPCSVNYLSEYNFVFFIVELKDYIHKTHINCTLQLLRCLTETSICYVPELYFGLIEKDTTLDPFVALQDAHRMLSDFSATSYFNNNHTITHKTNGINVSKEQLFKNIAARNTGIYETGNFHIHSLWAGQKPIEPVVPKVAAKVENVSSS